MKYGKTDHFVPVRGFKPDKCYRIYVVDAEVTDLEYEDWRDCFQHYLEDYIETLDDLQRAVRDAKQAVKYALQGFCNKHNIFPASAAPGENKLTPAQLAALIAAMQAARGTSFIKKAGKIGDGRLLGA